MTNPLSPSRTETLRAVIADMRRYIGVSHRVVDRWADALESLLAGLQEPPGELRDTIRMAGKRLRDRVEAIRVEAVNPARGFDIGWQLGRLRDDIENTTVALMKEVAPLPASPSASTEQK